jgi:MOSC domain-containing protein YiiM
MKELHGIVSSVMVMEPGMSPSSTPKYSVQVIPEGIEGDLHAGLTMLDGQQEIPNTRQISLVSEEELAEVALAMDVPMVNPEWVGANLMVSGIPNLSHLPHGSQFIFPDGVVLFIAEENTPCTSAGRAVQEQYPNKLDLSSAFPKAALGKRGLLAWVEQPGEISVGDTVNIQLPS